MLFTDTREPTVVYAVLIAHHWKFYVILAELACSDHVVVCSLLKQKHSVDVPVAG